MKFKSLNRSFFAVLAWGLLAMGTAVSAQERIYSCEASYQSSDGFVGPQIVFFIDEAKGSVRVLDGIVQHYSGGPVEGKLTKRSDKIFVINWAVDNIKSRERIVGADYRANLNISRNRYTMKAVVRGYDNNSRGEGRCKLVQ